MPIFQNYIEVNEAFLSTSILIIVEPNSFLTFFVLLLIRTAQKKPAHFEELVIHNVLMIHSHHSCTTLILMRSIVYDKKPFFTH